ncbi:MAG: penicillin acylase family protein [Opitutus sp.]|nr:penicillin acylase family protein [Opitutus sp.]
MRVGGRRGGTSRKIAGLSVWRRSRRGQTLGPLPMTSPLRKRLQILFSLLSLLAVLALAAAAIAYSVMRSSLPQLDGAVRLAGLSVPVKVERDAQGVPRITGAARNDVARALGFLHAQDRYFQMDLLRRRAAGELAELFGPAALPLDKSARLHGFRGTAAKVVAAMPPGHRARLDAYVAGVNAGLQSLPRRPWEYLALRLEPRAWTAEDSILCVYAMWFDLQDSTGSQDLSMRALAGAYGAGGAAFFAPRGNSADAAIDGTAFPAPELPALRLKAPEETPTAALAPADLDPSLRPGSNSFAVAGTHTASGVALLANDMHLGLNVPHVWYRAEFNWRDPAGRPHRVVGVTLPGTPTMAAGSNGSVAWGFTNSYIDTTDVVIVDTYADLQYRSPAGWRDIEDRTETIKVKGQADAQLTVRWTEWGPLIGAAEEGRAYALRWSAHSREAMNLNLAELETAGSVADGIALAHQIGMPNQNILLADRTGRIAWTLTGRIPKRVGYDGRLPVSWGYGDRKWDGWLKSEETPVVTSAPLGLPAEAAAKEGVLWTANNRVVGGEAYAKLGDAGYDNGHRAKAIRDDLLELVAKKKAEPADLLTVQLDDRAPYLGRWRKLLLETLDDKAVAQKKARGEMHELARGWQGRAATDSAGYRLIRGFKAKVTERALAPFLVKPQQSYERFRWGPMVEDAVWRLITEKPTRLLNPDHPSWESLLLAAADDVIADADKDGRTLAQFTWGARNTLRMQHPFSRFLPAWLGRWLDMPAEPLPGDSNLPRVQSATFGASQRLVVAPGREDEGIFQMPGGQSGHPLSPFYRAGHDDWAQGRPTPLLPGPAAHTLTLTPQ